MRRFRWALAAALLILVASCGGPGGDRPGAGSTTVRHSVSGSPAPPCLPPLAAASGSPGSTGPAPGAPGSAAAPPDGTAPAGGGVRLPDVALPCFVGGRPVDGPPVRLASLRGPAVVNLWASWCAPCREELPQIGRFAERATGRVRVFGVITSDPNRSGAQSIVDDFGLRFPMLYDEKAQLRTGVGGLGLPMTLFVDADGRVAHTYMARPLDEAAVADLVERYLGVRVT